MTFKEMALNMYPYWLLGLGMIFCTIKAGFKDLIRVEKAAVIKFLQFMGLITVFRVVLFTLFPGIQDFLPGDVGSMVDTIPLGATGFVFWEDMVHTLPLLILFSYLNDSKIANAIRMVLTGIVMFAFGMGHTYQGYLAAFVLSFYIPYSLKLGEKYGLGTVMVCHTLFDFITLITLRTLLG